MFKAKATWPVWLIRLRMPEFWPTWIIYLPTAFYYFWHTLRLGNKYWPVILNPGIDSLGGFIGANKKSISDIFPVDFTPKTIQFNVTAWGEDLKNRIESEIQFPCFVKPANLMGGIGVIQIVNLKELESYILCADGDILVQSLIKGEKEYAVYINRVPGNKLKITSITGKNFLSVKGNGRSTIAELLNQNLRYKMAKPFIDAKWRQRFHEIPGLNEEILIQPVGNHNKGTEFIDLSHRITPEMEVFFDSVVPYVGIYSGRFDLKAENMKSLETGSGLGIIEFNGTNAEAVSYLDPRYSYFSAQKVIFRHLREQLKIAEVLIKQGVMAPSLKDGFKIIGFASKFKKEKTFTFKP